MIPGLEIILLCLGLNVSTFTRNYGCMIDGSNAMGAI